MSQSEEDPTQDKSETEENEYSSSGYDGESDSSYESESSDDTAEIIVGGNVVRDAAVSAAHNTRAIIHTSLNQNYAASISMGEIIQNGSKHPWELINPSGVHPKDRKKSIFHYDLSKLPNTVEAKPWTAPDADITDWFNYGFNEQTWEVYRKKMLEVITNDENNNEIKVLTNEAQRRGAMKR